MHALIDLDILCYEMGSAHSPDDPEVPLEWPLVQWRVDARITQIVDAVEADSWEGYLTGKGNFREQIATIKPYKGSRKREERPFWFYGIYNYLRDEYGASVVGGMEADDAIAIEHMTNYNDGGRDTIICSRDKDFDQLPGWHYSWPGYMQDEKSPYFIEELDAVRFHYKQLVLGDAVDNILGLYNVGPKSAICKKIDELEEEKDMFNLVAEEYRKRFGSYWGKFMLENGILLWLKRDTSLLNDTEYEKHFDDLADWVVTFRENEDGQSNSESS